MTNLIGDEVDDYARWLAVPGAAVHLYGKGAPRPGRKMGHVTQVSQLAPPIDGRRAASPCIPARRLSTAQRPSRLGLDMASESAATGPQVDIPCFRSGTCAPKVERMAICRPSRCLTNSNPIQLEEDSACRFSFATTMSIKPSRR